MSDLFSKIYAVALLATLATFLSPPCAAAARDALSPANPLNGSDTLVSPGGVFALGFYTPAGSADRFVAVWFNSMPLQPETVVWIMNRRSPVNDTSAAAALSLDPATGSLLISGDLGNGNATAPRVYWRSTSNPGRSLTSPVAKLLDSGNFVVVDAASGGEYLWQSFDYPTDTLLADMKFGVDKKTNLDRSLVAWAGEADPSPGDVRVLMDISGDPEAFLWVGKKKVWRTGPWDGVHFSGVPTTLRDFNYSFVDSPEEVVYTYRPWNASVLSTLRLDHSGVLQRWVWLAGVWAVYWYAPKDPCDYLSPCGPNGVCDAGQVIMCSCLPGFTPANQSRWALRDGRDGCERATALDCVNGTDGFVTVAQAKVPDTTTSIVDAGVGDMEACKARCKANCSCTACAAADVVAGKGCVMWFGGLADLRVYDGVGGQDLHVRLAAADIAAAASQPRVGARAALAASLAIAATLLTGGFCFFAVRRWRKSKVSSSLRRGVGTPHVNSSTLSHALGADASTDEEDLELPLLDLETVVTATDGFSIHNKLGKGGFGTVYKGKLANGQEVAIKRLSKTSMQGVEEFKNEVRLIAKLQHRNLVRLLGCCIHGDEKMLVYEFLPNGSLDALLFDKSKSRVLDWRTRHRIIVGVARGLLYLHEDSRLRIIHRDLKASNILLDGEMNPKISDFGMARIFGGGDDEISTLRVVGTYGYMSPEYAMDGIFSIKSDIFSFGVLVLEIISGRRNRGAYVNSNHMSLLAHAWSLWKDGKILQLVDEAVEDSCPEDEVLKLLKLGLLCSQEMPEDRPKMSSVISMLGRDSASSLPEPKQPGFATMKGPAEGTESASSGMLESLMSSGCMTIIQDAEFSTEKSFLEKSRRAEE